MLSKTAHILRVSPQRSHLTPSEIKYIKGNIDNITNKYRKPMLVYPLSFNLAFFLQEK